MRARRSAAALVVFACLVVLAGCNSNPSPSPLPSSSPSATPSDSPSPTPPTMPAEAKGTSEASAKAFVRYYIDSVNFAMRGGDTKPLDSLSSARCDSCKSVAENIREVYENGGSLRGQGWRVEAIRLVPAQPESRPILETQVFVSSQEKVASPGADPEHFDGGKNLMTFYLDGQSNEWTVAKWDQTQ